MFLWFPYFSPKSLGFFNIRLFVCFRVTPSQLLIEFPFVVLECPALSVLFYPLSISLSSSFFGQYFLVYFLRLYCYFSLCCLFLLSPAYFSASLHHSGLFSYFFFICDSSVISHTGFCCFFVLFEGIPIFSQTNFAPAYINSFNSVILFVGM